MEWDKRGIVDLLILYDYNSLCTNHREVSLWKSVWTRGGFSLSLCGSRIKVASQKLFEQVWKTKTKITAFSSKHQVSFFKYLKVWINDNNNDKWHKKWKFSFPLKVGNRFHLPSQQMVSLAELDLLQAFNCEIMYFILWHQPLKSYIISQFLSTKK